MAQSNNELANRITEMLASPEPPISSEWCIYRVPRDLRKLNDEAYTPQLISIGPFHRNGNIRFETMEKHKVRYFKRFLERSQKNVKYFVSVIRDREQDVRRCYAETCELSSDDYVKMILLDASFIIVFIMIYTQGGWKTEDDEIVFTERLTNIVFADMWWLLENQLPFFIIDELYNRAFRTTPDFRSFTELTFAFFKTYNTQNISLNPDLKIKHFVDLLRTFFLPPSHRLPRNRSEKVMHLYTASELHEAGVKFKVSSSKCLFDLHFSKGVLEIPRLGLFDQTESYFRNLLAFEQCHYLSHSYVTDYIEVLDFLINTTKDVDLLVQKGILENGLGDSNAVTTLVNNLCKQILVSKTNPYYHRLCTDLNSFYDDPWHRWKAILRRDYFSTPWRIASIVAAVILLVLTFIQTVRSFR